MRRLAALIAVLLLCVIAAHAGAASAADRVWAWGDNQKGELGDNTTQSRYTPAPVHGITAATQAVAGSYDSLALLPNGTVMAWGWNPYGELGDNSEDERHLPVAVQGLSGVTGIAAGGHHSLAVQQTGTVAAWGDDEFGQLGNDSTSGESDVPVAVKGISTATEVAAGYGHSLALVQNGGVEAWGHNGFGELGNNKATGDSGVPVAVNGISGATQIAAGTDHSLALLAGGTVEAWGYNYNGQLGDNSTTERNIPVPVQDLTGVKAIAAGNDHSLALLKDGTVRAWGWNFRGQLGDGSNADSHVPVAVKGLTGVVRIAAVGDVSYAQTSDGRLWAWGDSTWGQLGNPPPYFGPPYYGAVLVPEQVTALGDGVSRIDSGCCGVDTVALANPAQLSNLHVAPSTFSIAGRLVNGRCVKPTAANEHHEACTRPVKLTVAFTLSRKTTVAVRIVRKERGVVVDGKCTKSTADGPPCTRFVPVTSFEHQSVAGNNSFPFKHALSPGAYVLSAAPAAGGAAQRAGFTVTK